MSMHIDPKFLAYIRRVMRHNLSEGLDHAESRRRLAYNFKRGLPDAVHGPGITVRLATEEREQSANLLVDHLIAEAMQKGKP